MRSSGKIALIAVTKRGMEQARLVHQRLRAGHLYRPQHYGPSTANWERLFAGPLADPLPDLFSGYEQLVFFLATGATVRLIAPLLESKQTDPGVLAIDESGQFVIPLVSGHEGGANAFARTVAACLGATPVITTASEAAGGLSLSMFEELFGWVPEPAERFKAAAMAWVNGQRMAVIQEIGDRNCWLGDRELPPHVTVVDGPAGVEADCACVIWITDRLVRDTGRIDPRRILWYRPRSLVVGVGCERGISSAALADGLRRVLDEHSLALASVHSLASLDLKADEIGLLELAEQHQWPTVFYDAERLSQVAGTANPSAVVEACVGTPGVAEPAALLAAETDRLLVEKQVVASPLAPQRMTIAVARLARFAPRHVAQGHVTFIGAGPGDPDLLTLKAHRLLKNADVVIYAGSLVPEEILRHAPPTARLHNSASLTLEDVTETMLAAARTGQRVVRLQSGDTSLYSTIQEQMTLLDEAGVSFDIVPGISSFQAAAAALATELTLPETVQTVILTRAAGQTKMPPGESLVSLAAHRATLCIFLSALLADEVQADLLTAYPADTPVAILYRVSWPDENIVVTTLEQLAAEMRTHRFTRTTLILVGEAVGGRKNRSRLYHPSHGHIFRASEREAANPPA